MEKTFKYLLLGLVLALLVVGSIQRELEPLSLKDFKDISDTADKLIVFAIDKSQRKSRTFNAELPGLVANLTKEFPDVRFVSVDNNEGLVDEDILFERFDILDFPTALWFRRGIASPIKKTLNETTIRSFLSQRISAAPAVAKSLNDEERLTGDNYTIYYYSKVDQVNGWFEGFASKFPTYRFVRTNDVRILGELATRYQAKFNQSAETIVLARRAHDNVLFTMDDSQKITRKSLERFIASSKRLDWSYLSNKSADLLQQSDKYVLLYLYDKEKDTKLLDHLKDLSKQYSDDLMSIFIEKGNNKGAELVESLGLPLNSSNIFVVHKHPTSGYAKFVGKPTVTSSEDSLDDFIQNCINEHHPRYYISEDAPSNDLFDGVTTLVGKTIDKKIFNDKDNYHVVFFYDSETASQIPAFQKIAKQLKNEKIKFYIFNSEKNENIAVDPLHHGTVVLYSNKKKMTIEKSFPFDRHLNGKQLLEFLKAKLAKDPEITSYLSSVELKEDL